MLRELHHVELLPNPALGVRVLRADPLGQLPLLLLELPRIAQALLIDRSLGLRNPAQLEKREGKLPAWVRNQYTDAEGRVWKELDLVQLAQHPDFLGVGI